MIMPLIGVLKRYFAGFVVGSLLLITCCSFAEEIRLPSSLLDVQQLWAHCQYQVNDDRAKQACFDTLITSTQTLLAKAPQDAKLKIWLAVSKGTLAAVKGGLGALSLVKESKILLEQVIDKDANVLAGAAYTNLGSLYYQVPKKPLSYGDDLMAEKLLRKALLINPKGIEPNYFYGDFLLQNGDKAQARIYFERAQKAARRVGRPVADKGRKMEILSKMKALK